LCFVSNAYKLSSSLQRSTKNNFKMSYSRPTHIQRRPKISNSIGTRYVASEMKQTDRQIL